MIGIFGGVFNPVHIGHLLLMEYIRDEFRLEKIIFVPAGKPPHKPNDELVCAQHRYNMVQLAIEKNPFFGISATELNRNGVAYTSDTLEEFQKRYPGKRLFFICGADSIINFPTWRNIGKIFDLADIVVAGRPKVKEDDFNNMVQLFENQYSARILLSNSPLVEISSTIIRERIKNNLSIRYMVPDEVYSYIRQHRLYKKV
jgi:nicotinate-nucleotide adenylyltransferase